MPLNERLQGIRDGKIALGEGYQTILALQLDGMDPALLPASEFTLLRGALERLYREFDEDLCACNSLTAAVLKTEHGLAALDRIPWEDLVRDRLFLDYLAATTNTDPVIEHVIVRVRKRLFLGNETSDPAPIVAAIAQQCFFNEYIYEIDAEEQVRLTERCESFSGDAPETLRLCMYRPPLSFLDEDAARRLAAASHPDSLDGAITRLVREPLEALDLAASLPRRACPNTQELSESGAYQVLPVTERSARPAVPCPGASVLYRGARAIGLGRGTGVRRLPSAGSDARALSRTVSGRSLANESIQLETL